MKKNLRKLSLRRETLTHLDLGRAAGGTVLPAPETDLCTVVTGPNTCCCTPPPHDTDVVVP